MFVCQCHPKKANPTTEKTTALTKDQGIFTYCNNVENYFKDQQFLPREFTNLKKNIKRHLADSHTKNVKAEEEKSRKRFVRGKERESWNEFGRLCIITLLERSPLYRLRE